MKIPLLTSSSYSILNNYDDVNEAVVRVGASANLRWPVAFGTEIPSRNRLLILSEKLAIPYCLRVLSQVAALSLFTITIIVRRILCSIRLLLK